MMKFWIAAAIMGLALSAHAADPVSPRTAESALFSPKGAQAVIKKHRALSANDVKVLEQVAATQKYYGAVAISPEEGLVSEATVAAANFHDVANASKAAIASCNAKRKKGSDACVIVAEILPVGWKKGAAIQLSTDATGAVGQGVTGALAASPSTGHWGVGAEKAALAACAAMGGAKDCAIVVQD